MRKSKPTDPFVSGGLLGYLVVPDVSWLIKAFGPPMTSEADQYKVTTAWRFVDDEESRQEAARLKGVRWARAQTKDMAKWALERAATFTIYDWKATSKYERGLPSIAAFRKMKNVLFHVGANTADKEDLRKFLHFFATTLLAKAGVDYRPEFYLANLVPFEELQRRGVYIGA